MRRVLPAACLGAIAICAAAGCDGLFGIQDGVLSGDAGASDGTGGGGDGMGDEVDSGIADNRVPEAAGEGAVDVATQDVAEAGPLQTLTCNTWRYAQPFMVANLQPYSGTCAGSYQGVSAFSTDANTVRVVASRCGAPALFSVYSVDKTKSPPAVTSVDMTYTGTDGGVLAVVRLDGGFGVVTGTTTGGTMAVDLYPFLDANPITPLPQPVPLAQLPNQSPAFERGINVLQVGPSDYFVAVDEQNGSFEDLEIGVAAGGTPASLSQVDGLIDLFEPVLAHAGSSVFIYVSQQSMPAAFYQVPDTASTGGTRTSVPELDPPSGSAYFIDAVPGSGTARTNLAYVESDPNDAGQFGSFNYRASPVGNATLPSLKATDIAFGKSYTDLGSTPTPLNPIRFFGDDFVVIGPGEDGSGNPTAWMNFLWLNVNGVVRGEQSGVNGLLSGHLIDYIAQSPSGASTATTGAWNLAWSEGVLVDGGQYDALFLNELDCK